jgi:hypothetical protein
MLRFTPLWKVIVGLALGLLLFLPLSLSSLTWVQAQLMTNSGFNYPYQDIPGRTWNGQPEKIANGWQPFYLADGTYRPGDNASKLHWLSAAQFAAAFGGVDYRLEGDQAQNMWSSYEMNAGVYQQVPVTPGQDYGFDVAMVTYWRGPGFADSDGKMVKQLGIDPFGGSDPTSSNIIWSETNDNDKAWVYMDMAATAQATTMTVFAKVQAPDNESVNHTDLNMVYFDAAHFDLAPTTSLTASQNGSMVNLTWSGAAQAGWSLKGYEVRYQDQTNSAWTTLQAKSGTQTSGNFSIEAGHTYIIQARTWQTRQEGYNSDIDMPGVWQEAIVKTGGNVEGAVLYKVDGGVLGATVSANGTSAQTVSGLNGDYNLVTGAGVFSLTAATGDGWQTLEPVPVTVAVTSTAALSLSLSPPDNFVQNGVFAANLDGWNSTLSQTELITEGIRGGQYSLLITGSGVLSQAGSISDSFQPVLAFWYKADGGDGDDSMIVQISGDSGLPATSPFTLPTATADWAFGSLSLVLSGTDVYSGPLEVQFIVNQTGPTPTNYYLDQVSFGSAWNSLRQVYLPLVKK